MAPDYLTDRFALNNRMHVCHNLQLHIYSISIVNKQSGDSVSYYIGNMNIF